MLVLPPLDGCVVAIRQRNAHLVRDQEQLEFSGMRNTSRALTDVIVAATGP